MAFNESRVEPGGAFERPTVKIGDKEEAFDRGNVMGAIDSLRREELFPVASLVGVLNSATKLNSKFPNVRTLDIQKTGCVIVGDLHGQLDDLFIIFSRMGLPSTTNPFVFNGDFVDRGKKGAEVSIILALLQLLCPGSVFLNRGNHEDILMSKYYGFEEEITEKYGEGGKKDATVTGIMMFYAKFFASLPLAVLVKSGVESPPHMLVLHGGLDDKTSLKILQTCDRFKHDRVLFSALQFHGDVEVEDVNFDTDGAKAVISCTWSDPVEADGCERNTTRKVGFRFGPDVTARFLDEAGLKLLVRSHECIVEGHSTKHDGKILTVFSASNYNGPGSNKGAVACVDADFKISFEQWSAESSAQNTIAAERRPSDLCEEMLWRELKKMNSTVKSVVDLSGPANPLMEAKGGSCGCCIS